MYCTSSAGGIKLRPLHSFFFATPITYFSHSQSKYEGVKSLFIILEKGCLLAEHIRSRVPTHCCILVGIVFLSQSATTPLSFSEVDSLF